MKAVLDTNVLISGVISTGTSHEVLIRGFKGDYTIITSAETIQEFEETLLRYPEKFKMDKNEIKTEKETIEYYSEIVVPNQELAIIEKNPNDNMFLEAAVTSNAHYIVSGDKHLLDIANYKETKIVTPDEFLEQINSEQNKKQ